MLNKAFLHLCFIGVSFLLSFSSSANTTSLQENAKNLACISGGIGESERDALQKYQETQSFWLITAAKKTGEFLSDIKVRILDKPSHKEVISCVMNGPWLFVNLPIGQYEVEAIYVDKVSGKEQKIKKRTRIHSQDHHQMLMYFDVNERAK